jgi:iron complex outermembrane recepter protein
MTKPKAKCLLPFLGGVSALTLVLGTAPVRAQTTLEASTGVGEVVVSASRRREKARDVPVAVTSISGQKLDVINSSGLDIRFLSARVPSLSIESSFGRTYPRFYIRGLGNTDFDVNAQQPVSLVYDDVALENPLLKSSPIFDLESVEVLRGPQGTLFGRNTPAGVVKASSARPTDHFTGYGSAAYGTYGTVNAEGAVSGPLGYGFTARLSGLLQKRDDWVKNTATTGLASKKLEGYTDAALRLQVAYGTGPFTALLNVHGRSLDGTPRIFRAGLFKQGSNAFSSGFNVEKVALDGYTDQQLSSKGASLHLTYAFEGLGTLHSITALESAKVDSSGDIDGGNNYIFPPLGLNNALFYSSTGGISRPEEFSQELRFETEQFGKVRGQFGYYYFTQNLKYNELDFTTAGAVDADVRHKNLAINYGVFASAEVAATDALTLRGGLRYSSDKKKDLIYGQGILTGVALPVTSKVDGDNVSGDISATYVLTPTVNIYARLATGYQGPAIQDRVNFFSVPTTAKAQTSTSGETGIKTLLFDRKMRFDLAAFYYEAKDLQLTAVGGSSNSAKLLNAAKAEGYGLEADIEARPIDSLLLTAGGAWNHTAIKDKAIGVAPCGSGMCTVLDPVVAGLARIDGNPLPQAPEWTANLTAKYTWPLGSGSKVYVYTDWAYRSEVNFFLYEATEFVGKTKVEGGLRVGYVTEGGLELDGYVRNITDQIVAESAIDFNNLTGMVSEPRTFGVSIRKAF